METIEYLNVDEKSIWTRDGFLHFIGREGDEEAQTHHLNLSGIKRWKFANDTLTVVFFPEEHMPQLDMAPKGNFADEFLDTALKGQGLAKELGVELEGDDRVDA